jgi:hypothetical protein
MSITEKQRQQQAELQKNLWSIEDIVFKLVGIHIAT